MKIYNAKATVEPGMPSSMCISFEDKDGNRFHLWREKDGSFMHNRLFKNPPKGSDAFKTRYLDATNAANRGTIEKVLSMVDLGAAVEAFQLKKAEEAETEKRESAAYQAKQRLEKVAPDLLKSMQTILYAEFGDWKFQANFYRRQDGRTYWGEAIKLVAMATDKELDLITL